MFEILYGRVPFENREKLFLGVENCDVYGDSAIIRLLNWMISRCLSRNPELRPEMDWISIILRLSLEVITWSFFSSNRRKMILLPIFFPHYSFSLIIFMTSVSNFHLLLTNFILFQQNISHLLFFLWNYLFRKLRHMWGQPLKE